MSLMRDVRIRAPSSDEREEFFEVYNTGLPGVDEISEKRFSEWWERCYESGELERLWRVAVLGKTIVGVVINVFNDILRWGFIWELAIHPDYRGQGIGTYLIKESEKILKKHYPDIRELAIGVKTTNYRALSLYEKIDYGIRFVELHLRGKKWIPEGQSTLKIEPPSQDIIPDLMKLTPDSYWSTRNEDSWRELLKPEHRIFRTNEGLVVGYIRMLMEKRKKPHTEIQFNIRPDYGPQVLDACMELLELETVEFWIQDNHQDILDILYLKGYKRIESEFLLRKPVIK
ncbi:MAG: GNAT family N-acetyltransferase [Candidatus Thorarchaeota archaeon]|nr:GNAT family N-acetyltransferase [Candidatus Thorarchaeota archaeon]